MAANEKSFVVTAFDTDSGAPVYLDESGAWVPDLQKAHPRPEAESDAMVHARMAEDQRAVCDPYHFPVEVRGGRVDPLSVRETIRSSGPTTRLRRPD